jgi:hypothetical protein
MNWTFGIITNGNNPSYILQICNSIHNLGIPDDKYEIRVVGGDSPNFHNVIHIPFNENQKKAWITKKKNTIFQTAKFENISIGHDYIEYKPDWYEGMLKFNSDYDVLMCRIGSKQGLRYRDHCSWYCENGQQPGPNTVNLLDYDDLSQTNKQYISGSYFCIKKDFALKHPLNERLSWGQAEDVEWSYRVRNIWNYKFNKYSTVQFLKDKDLFPYNEQRICDPIL